MILNFKSIGLKFEAECQYAPGWPGSYLEPPESPELEILKLRHEAADVSFLLDSGISDQLHEDAWDALRELAQDELYDEAAADEMRYTMRHQDVAIQPHQ